METTPSTTPSHKVRLLFWIVFALFVGTILVSVLWYVRKTGDETAQTENIQSAAAMYRLESKALPAEQAPDRFPANIPIEASAPVSQNFAGTTGNGDYQGTKQFVSAKTPEVNAALYEQYFKTNGWKIVNSSKSNPNLMTLVAVKDNQNFIVTISKNSVNGQTSVDLTVSE